MVMNTVGAEVEAFFKSTRGLVRFRVQGIHLSPARNMSKPTLKRQMKVF